MIKKISTLNLFLCFVGLLIYLNFDYLNNLLVLKFFGYKNEFHLKLPDIDYKENAKYSYKGNVKSVKCKEEFEANLDFSETEFDRNGNVIKHSSSYSCWIPFIYITGGSSEINKYNDKGYLEYSENQLDTNKKEIKIKYYYYNKIGNLKEIVSPRSYYKGDIEYKDTIEHIKFSYVDYPDEDLLKVIKKDEDGYVLKVDYYKYDELNRFQEAYIDDVFYYFNGHSNYLVAEYNNAINEYDYSGNEIFGVYYAYQNYENKRVTSLRRQKYDNGHFLTESKNYSWAELTFKKYDIEKESFLIKTELLNFKNLVEENWLNKYSRDINSNPIAVESFKDGKKIIDFSIFKYDSHGNIIYNPTRKEKKYSKKYSFEYYE